MSTRLIVDKQEGLKESGGTAAGPQPPGIRLAATIFSYIFHPVFVPVYLVLFMVYVHPYLFAGISAFDKTRAVIMAFVMYTLFPVVTTGLLKALNFIESFQLKTQRDRIIPLVLCGIWYGWICYVWWNSSKMGDSLIIPKAAVRLTFAIFIASWFALMANIKMKISLHAISMGVMVTFILSLAFSQQLNFGVYISLALLVTGLVCSSRFLISDHSPAEVYGGLAAGIFAMLLGNWVT